MEIENEVAFVVPKGGYEYPYEEEAEDLELLKELINPEYSLLNMALASLSSPIILKSAISSIYKTLGLSTNLVWNSDVMDIVHLDYDAYMANYYGASANYPLLLKSISISKGKSGYLLSMPNKVWIPNSRYNSLAYIPDSITDTKDMGSSNEIDGYKSDSIFINAFINKYKKELEDVLLIPNHLLKPKDLLLSILTNGFQTVSKDIKIEDKYIAELQAEVLKGNLVFNGEVETIVEQFGDEDTTNAFYENDKATITFDYSNKSRPSTAKSRLMATYPYSYWGSDKRQYESQPMTERFKLFLDTVTTRELMGEHLDKCLTVNDASRIFTMACLASSEELNAPIITTSSSFEVPMHFMQYITQQENPDICNALTWFCKSFAYFSGITDEKSQPQPCVGLDSILALTDNSIKPRVNKDNVAIIGTNGELIYLPEVDKSEYENYLKGVDTLYTVSTKDTVSCSLSNESRPNLTEILLDKGVSSPQSKLLYIDWKFNRIIFSTTNGALSNVDLNGTEAATLTHYDACINKGIKNNQFRSMLTRIEPILKSHPEFIEYTDYTHLLPMSKRSQYVESNSDVSRIGSNFYEAGGTDYHSQVLAGSINNLIGNINRDTNLIGRVEDFVATLSRLATSSLSEIDDYDELDYETADVQDIINQPHFAFIKRACQYSIKIVKDDGVNKVVDNYWKGSGVTNILTDIGYMIAVTTNPKDIKLAVKKELDSNAHLDELTGEEITPQPTPNIKDDMTLLPHQIVVDHRLSTNPKTSVIHVEAGGGKTLIAILSMLKDLKRCNAKKRVLVISPDYLISNYIADTNFASNGKVNVFSITSEIVTRYGVDGLHDAINKCPPNTIFVAGLNFFSRTGATATINYLGTLRVVNLIVEMMRSIDWGYVYIDESHMLANQSSQRSQNVLNLISGIENRRIMSGTLVNSTISDVYGQSKLLDPSIYRSQKAFTERYGEEVRGDKIIVPTFGAEVEMRSYMGTRTNYSYVPRKNWAALLPEKKENFYFVNLSKEQQHVYNAIMKQVVAEVELDESLKSMLNTSYETEGNSTDDEATTIVEDQLKPYLAKLERFLTAPNSLVIEEPSEEIKEKSEKLYQAQMAAHIALNDLLQNDEGESIVSPKVPKINEILKAHFSNPKQTGKVLIFTSYKASAKAIYDNLAPEFKKYALHYEASDKDILIPRMKKDPNVKIVIGVENSLNTGHNFTAYNRLIRTEQTWTPGTLEQSEARIYRPNPKEKETRTAIYIDYVFCDKTLDITKTARLIGKQLSKAKFDNIYSTGYSELPDLPLVAMSFDNIFNYNDFENNLADYLDAYTEMKALDKKEFEEFKEHVTIRESALVPKAEDLPNSAIADVPYIANMSLPFQTELGLVSLYDYSLDLGIPLRELTKEHLYGSSVHCEAGDGVITSVSKDRVNIKVNGEIKSFLKLAVFLKTKPEIKDVKQAMKNLIGGEYAKTDKKRKVKPDVVQQEDNIEVKPKKDKKVKPNEIVKEIKVKTKKVKDEDSKDNEKPKGTRSLTPPPVDEEGYINLYIETMSNFIITSISTDEESFTPADAKDFGMKDFGPYYFCKIRNAKQLGNMTAALREKFKIPKSTYTKLEELYEAIKAKSVRKLSVVEKITGIEVKNFYRKRRVRPGKDEVYIFPVVLDGELYLCAYAEKQATAKKLLKVKVPGCRFYYEPDSYYYRIHKTKADAKDFIKAIRREFTIANYESLKEDFKLIRVKKRKDDEVEIKNLTKYKL